MHGRLDLPGLGNVIQISASPLRLDFGRSAPAAPGSELTATILHGLPLDLFRPSAEPGSYLAFLGCLTVEKGPERCYPHRARSPATSSHCSQDPSRRDRLLQEVFRKPLIDGKKVHLVGEVDDAKKQPFLAQAAGLLFPIDWPEPFGLVMIEAMACGTPVIAYRSGSVPEVIEDGAVTGFIVEDKKQAIAAVHRVEELDRRKNTLHAPRNVLRGEYEWRKSTSSVPKTGHRRGSAGTCSFGIFNRPERERTREDGSRKSVAVSHACAGHPGGGRSGVGRGRAWD